MEIADGLLREARKLAVREGMTLRALIERARRGILSEEKEEVRFRLRKASFKGRGLQEGARGASWEEIRERIYEGRGS